MIKVNAGQKNIEAKKKKKINVQINNNAKKYAINMAALYSSLNRKQKAAPAFIFTFAAAPITTSKQTNLNA